MNNHKISLMAVGIFAALLIILTLPTIKYASSTLGNSTSFNVSLTISNSAPVVIYVAPISGSPSDGVASNIEFTFNATDANGASDIPASNAQVSINQSGVTLSSSSCLLKSTSGSTNMYICNISINYYNLPGIWNINASVYDGASARNDNWSQNLTMGTTYATTLKTNTLTFSGSPGQTAVSASNNPQYVNNTGNGAFSQINLTAYDLVGPQNISASSFYANTSSSTAGHALINKTQVVLANSSLAVQNSRNIYIYMNIPSGVANGTYTSMNAWVVSLS